MAFSRRGTYWLKEHLNNCTIGLKCPYCDSYFKCLEKFYKQEEKKLNLGGIVNA